MSAILTQVGPIEVDRAQAGQEQDDVGRLALVLTAHILHACVNSVSETGLRSCRPLYDFCSLYFPTQPQGEL